MYVCSNVLWNTFLICDRDLVTGWFIAATGFPSPLWELGFLAKSLTGLNLGCAQRHCDKILVTIWLPFGNREYSCIIGTWIKTCLQTSYGTFPVTMVTTNLSPHREKKNKSVSQNLVCDPHFLKKCVNKIEFVLHFQSYFHLANLKCNVLLLKIQMFRKHLYVSTKISY
jgi:hypothetical protein